jgi:chaperonin cofactor prefoldin
MIQSTADKGATSQAQEESDSQRKSKGKIGPLALRLTTLEKEIQSLEERLAVLQSEIMGAGGAAALVQKGAKPSEDQDDLSLLKSSKEGTTIKERTASAEAKVAELHSGLATLENQVKGDASASLLEVKDSGSNLMSRIGTLEKKVEDLRTRMSTLEHTVMG